jgi:hypothetical protein
MTDQADSNNPGNTLRDAMTFSPRELPEDHPADAETRSRIYTRKDVSVSVQGAAPEPSDDWVSKQDPAGMVKEVTDQIRKLQTRLQATTGRFDPQTGEPELIVTGRDRNALERQLTNLQATTLPATVAQAAKIAQAQAALPTAEDRLREEGARRDRIAARALELAEEEEAKQQASRILASRGSNKG